MPLAAFDSPSGSLHFRSPTLDDVPNMLERAYDPECVRYLPHIKGASEAKLITAESNTRRVQAWRASCFVKDVFVIVVRKSDGKVIGDGGFESLDLDKKQGDAGVMLNSGPDIRGKGYAVESMKAFFQLGFEDIGLERIRVQTLKANNAMRGVMEKHFGLVAEESEGEFGAECCFTLHKEDWVKRFKV